MFRDRLIVDDSLVAEDAGYSIRARMPWYRALPLSCLVEITLGGLGGKNGNLQRGIPELHDVAGSIVLGCPIHRNDEIHAA